MSWEDNLDPEQCAAASYTGTPARLLAGPGTGKTLVMTRRIQFLVEERAVPTNEILSLTFTRAAAYELRQRLQKALPTQLPPRVSTLHSFALRQLLVNSGRLTTLPQPLRIADDWEERNIILEDVKTILNLDDIKAARELFSALSSDWETLAAEQAMPSPDAHFLGAWEEHRRMFGYTLRAELVYQLKRALEQLPAFALEAPTRHLLVDEYQDLNQCDLAVIKALTSRGAELFAAGDDDQSIYGFRKAHPDGIKNFLKDYPGAVSLPLTECKRCDSSILALGEFVANLDPRRLEKHTHCGPNRPQGELALLRFDNNDIEARQVASLCKQLIEAEHVKAEDILVLLRTDTNGAFSGPLHDAFALADVPIAMDPASRSPLDGTEGRQVLAFLRLMLNPQDHLSWRTLFQLRKNNLGEKALSGLYDHARSSGLTYAAAIRAVVDNPATLPRFGDRFAAESRSIASSLDSLRSQLQANAAQAAPLNQVIGDVVARLGHAGAHDVVDYLLQIADETGSTNIQELLQSLEASSMDIEPDIQAGKVNILTMHKAKGLSATAVIILATEDEHLPGRQDREPELGDERRLLFVSLTRAKNMLFLTYCGERVGQQKMMGKKPGDGRRTLSQFLRNAPLRPASGIDYIAHRATLATPVGAQVQP